MDERFTVHAAGQAADSGDLGGWVARFLASPGSDNPELAEELTAPPRWWFGPVRVPLDALHRLAGPADAPVLEVVDEEEWRDDVDDLAGLVEDAGFEPPPVIVSVRGGQLVVEDGNHRLEALRRAGHERAWAVLGVDRDA